MAAVVDLFSRRVVGRSMSDTMTAELVTDAPIMSVGRRGKPDALLHPSDLSSTHISEQFQRLIVDNGVTCSMSRSSNFWQAAAMECFFSSLKTERQQASSPYNFTRFGHRSTTGVLTHELDQRSHCFR